MGIPQGHSYSGYGFTWLHSAAPFCIQASLLHMPGHRGDGAVCLSLCPAGRQCEHLNLSLKSSEASSFGCNFSILQSSLNFSLEPKTTLCSSRAQRQYFHHKLTLFQTGRACPVHLFFTLSPPVAPEMSFQPPTDVF